MPDIVLFDNSKLLAGGTFFATGRMDARDIIVSPNPAAAPPEVAFGGAEAASNLIVYPADYANMLTWDRSLAPRPRLVPLNQEGFRCGFGAGNRMVVAAQDAPCLRHATTLAGWDGIFAAMRQSLAPFWFIQQSIVRELIPEGVDPSSHPEMGHTGGYGPRELLRAGLFAFASQGGYARHGLPIGADADHAIVTGHDEESLAHSLELNKLAMAESRDYTKFTVDTSHLFHFPTAIPQAALRRLNQVFLGRHFTIPNIVPGRPGPHFEFDREEVAALAAKYWRPCVVHKELYDHVVSLRGGMPFDYELSLDETPEPTPPRELLFYLVVLYEVLDLPLGAVASAGPNIGFTKRHDFEGQLKWLHAQANACASILHHFEAMLSVHSADGVQARTGKGPGVDPVLRDATGSQLELKVADVYQEVLWQVLARSPEPEERDLFCEAWRRTCDACNRVAAVYHTHLANRRPGEAQSLINKPHWEAQVAAHHGEDTLRLVQGVAAYGLHLFRLASDLLPVTDLERPDPQAELFRRFMFLTYRSLRPALFQTLSSEGWKRLSRAIEEATMIRLRAMGWSLET